MTDSTAATTALRKKRGRPKTVRPEAEAPPAAAPAVGEAIQQGADASPPPDDNADHGDEHAPPAGSAEAPPAEGSASPPDGPAVTVPDAAPVAAPEATLFICAITNHSPYALHLRACGLFIGGGRSARSGPVDRIEADRITAVLAAEIARQGIEPDRVIVEISSTPE